MRYCYVPTPHSIYKGIKKLEPGTILTVSLKQNSCGSEKYWDTLDVVRKGAKEPFEGSVSEITNNLDTVLKKTVSQQMMADVPLGAFLSGGVDSSVVAALLHAAIGDQLICVFIGHRIHLPYKYTLFCFPFT